MVYEGIWSLDGWWYEDAVEICKYLFELLEVLGIFEDIEMVMDGFEIFCNKYDQEKNLWKERKKKKEKKGKRDGFALGFSSMMSFGRLAETWAYPKGVIIS